MIRAALGVVAAIVAMAVVIFVAVKLHDIRWAPPVALVLSCFAGGCAGTFVGRTRWSGWIPVVALFAFVIFTMFYFFYLRPAPFQYSNWWRLIAVPTGMLVACWCGTLLASRYMPVVERVDLEDLQRAFE